MELQLPPLPEQPAPDRREILQMEKETMGIYVSDHPLRGYELSLRQYATHNIATILETEEPIKVTVAGVLSQVSKTVSQRTGTRVCRITLEDFSSAIGGPCFGETAMKFDAELSKDSVVMIQGRVRSDERSNATERTLNFKSSAETFSRPH
ncbi:MAG: OB-fold nucleic acid binding domain-containing protein [Fimbriimonadaceae bacterium]